MKAAQVRIYVDADILGFGDSKIIANVNEKALIRQHSAKMVALNQEDAKSKWGQLEVFMTQWRRIEPLINEAGPFIWRVSRTAMTLIPLI
jgi:hypothetical protein